MNKQFNECMERVLNDKAAVELYTENIIMEELLGNRNYSPKWKSTYFSPAGNLDDAMKFVNFLYPEADITLKYNATKGKYYAWVIREKFTGESKDAARALFIAAARVHIYSVEGLD